MLHFFFLWRLKQASKNNLTLLKWKIEFNTIESMLHPGYCVHLNGEECSEAEYCCNQVNNNQFCTYLYTVLHYMYQYSIQSDIKRREKSIQWPNKTLNYLLIHNTPLSAYPVAAVYTLSEQKSADTWTTQIIFIFLQSAYLLCSLL